jgi:hypothetical protein
MPHDNNDNRLLVARFESLPPSGDTATQRVRVLAVVNLLVAKHWDHFAGDDELIDDVKRVRRSSSIFATIISLCHFLFSSHL